MIFTKNMRTKKTNRSNYLNSVFSKEDKILKNIREYAEKQSVDYMQISAYEGGILQFLCKALNVKKAVEIGTLYGYSSLIIARALPSNGRLFTLDQDKNKQEQSQQLIKEDKHSHKIEFISGLANKSLKNLESKAPFDMVFIDADKTSYLDYLKWSYKNLKSGGLIIADNTFLFGAIYNESKKEVNQKALTIMKQFNKEISQSGLYTSTLIPTAEGLTVGIKK